MTPKYRRIVELGRGGMATVHLAAMRSSHNVTKLVVVKELDPKLAADPEFRSMFLEEARLAARLNHPNVVQTFEIVDHVDMTSVAPPDGLDGACALVMEYLDGQPLNRVRVRAKSDPDALPLYLAVLIDVLTGLDYAHGVVDYDGKPLHIVHRDVSPHNIFLTYSGEVKLLDFGIAKANDSAMAPTRVGVVKGKLAYMAPEQAAGARVDARADVFAVGVILWEAVVGRRLWQGLNDAAIMYRLERSEIPAPRDVSPEVPEAIDAVVRRALTPNPDDRYQSAAAFRDAIEGYAKTLPSQPSRRAIGEKMATLFSNERTQVRQIVEEQLGKAQKTATGEFTAATSGQLVRLQIPFETSTSLDERPGTLHGASSMSLAPPAKPRLGVRLAVGGAVLTTAGVIVALAVAGSRPTATTPPLTAPSAVVPVMSAPVVTSVSPAVEAPSHVVVTTTPPSARPSSHPAGHPEPIVKPRQPTSTVTRPGVPSTVNPTDVGY